MADFDIDNPVFDHDNVEQIDDDEAPLIDPTGDLPSVGQGQDTQGATANNVSLQQELLQTAVDDYYNALVERGLTPALGRDTTKFKLDRGQLRLKAYPNVNLVNSRTKKPLSLSTIAARPGGGQVIREELGFLDWTRAGAAQARLPAQAAAALQTAISKADKELGEAAAAVDTVELQDLGQTAKEASDSLHKMETTLTDTELDEILGTMDDHPLNLRELRGLDRALQTIRGELTNNLAKLSELDDHIAMEKRKLDEASEGTIDEFTRRRIAERLRNLQDERASRLEAAAGNREALRSQISRMRETINHILNADTTLAERIRTLFREQGITIASILTAIGMAISTLVLALTGSGGGAPSPAPVPSDKGGLKEWMKKHLQSLGRVLAKLAGKAAAALPGIIGSIISWLLSLLGKTAGWLAENMWAVALALGSLLLVAAHDWLSRGRAAVSPQQPKRN